MPASQGLPASPYQQHGPSQTETGQGPRAPAVAKQRKWKTRARGDDSVQGEKKRKAGGGCRLREVEATVLSRAHAGPGPKAPGDR